MSDQLFIRIQILIERHRCMGVRMSEYVKRQVRSSAAHQGQEHLEVDVGC